jgi:hypothetical protein
VTPFSTKSVLAVLALAAMPAVVRADAPCCSPCGGAFAMCKPPVTRSYRVEPGFCPQQLVYMIQNCVSANDADCCGPYGIPNIYVAGNWVLVRQTPEVHERVAKVLADLGAYVPAVTR